MTESSKNRHEVNGSLLEKITNDWKNIESSLSAKAVLPPRALMLELTNSCNLRCSFCSYPDSSSKKGMMSFDEAVKRLNEAKEFGIREVALFSAGESLLFKDVVRVAEESKKLGFYTYLTTNGVKLSRELAQGLCNAGIDSIKISVDAGTQEVYSKVKGRDWFDLVLENVRTLREIVDGKGGKIRIICSMVVTKDNAETVDSFRDKFSPLADDILISKATNLGGKIDAGNTNKEITSPQINPCRLLWDRIVVCQDGRITACCVDFDNELVYAGSDISLKEAWNNPTIVDWREKHLAGDVSSISLCKDCNTPLIQTQNKLLDMQDI